MYKFNIEADKLPIPCVMGYFVDKKGNISRSDGKVITKEEFINETGIIVNDTLVLTLITFQDFKWPFVYWKYLVVRKPENINEIENMVLGIENPVEDLTNPGYYLIPYFSGYVIDKRGNVLNVSSRTFVQASKTNNGYWTIRLKSDDGRISNRLTHRIIAMSFLPYPYNFQSLEVNHLNGDTLDDDYNNLEWSTKLSNLAHAKLNDLFRKRNPHKQRPANDREPIITNLLNYSQIEVKLKDVTNDNIYIFNSLIHASQILGLGIRGMKYALDANDGRVIKGYQIKYQSDITDWPTPVYTRAKNYKVVFEDGQSRICSAEEAARYCGVTRTSLQRLLREGRNKGKNNNITVERIGTGNVLY